MIRPESHSPPSEKPKSDALPVLRGEILDEARRLLAESGHSALSMRRIAGAVGCSATSIYLYFEGKDALVHALIEEGMILLNERLLAALGQETDPVVRLRSIAEAYLQFGLEHPHSYEAMFTLRAERMARYPQEKYRKARQNLELFTAQVAEVPGNGLQGDSLKTVGTLVWASLHGAVTLLLAKRIDRSIPQALLLDLAVEQAVRLALAPSSPPHPTP